MSHSSVISDTALLTALNWRYATKKFDPAKVIPADTWATLEQSLVLAPSSFGMQPWKFLVIDTAALKAQLVSLSWGQTQPVDASHFVVLAVRSDLPVEHVDRYVARTAEVRSTTVEALAPFRNVMVGAVERARGACTLDRLQTNQVYIALGQFMAAAALLGVDTCPMEGIEPAKYDAVLGLTGTGWKTVVACAAGYRADDDKYATTPKVRFPVHEVVEHR